MVGSKHPLQFCYYSCLCKTSDDIIVTSDTTTTTLTIITTSITTDNPTTEANNNNNNNNNNNLYVNFLQDVPSSVLEILAATYSPKTEKKSQLVRNPNRSQSLEFPAPYMYVCF